MSRVFLACSIITAMLTVCIGVAWLWPGSTLSFRPFEGTLTLAVGLYVLGYIGCRVCKKRSVLDE